MEDCQLEKYIINFGYNDFFFQLKKNILYINVLKTNKKSI